MKKKCLVLVKDYPKKNGHSMMYVHVRNKYYLKKDIVPTVLNFSAKNDYEYDGIKVITLNTYKGNKKQYDLLICHAPNLKNHYVFLKKYQQRFKTILFIFHGHEVLRISEEYPPQYKWKKSKVPMCIRDMYDTTKFALWGKYLKKLNDKSYYIFVSNWLYKRFKKNLKFSDSDLRNKVSIISNSVGKEFEKKEYDKTSKKEYDFITIRGSSLDQSKYGISIVYDLAKMNKDKKFLIIGRGNFFKHNVILPNITFIQETLKHTEMMKYIDKSKCALLPTREDTQGVMACEMIAYGIPLITSNIEVCREIFAKQRNVKMINNDLKNVDLGQALEELTRLDTIKDRTYFEERTVEKEINVIEKLCNG